MDNLNPIQPNINSGQNINADPAPAPINISSSPEPAMINSMPEQASQAPQMPQQESMAEALVHSNFVASPVQTEPLVPPQQPEAPAIEPQSGFGQSQPAAPAENINIESVPANDVSPQIRPALAQSSTQVKPEIEIETMSMDYKEEEPAKAGSQPGITAIQPSGSSKKMIMIAVIAAGVVALAGGGFFAFTYFKDQPSEDLTPVSTGTPDQNIEQKTAQELLDEKINLASSEIESMNTAAFEADVNAAASALDKVLQ